MAELIAALHVATGEPDAPGRIDLAAIRAREADPATLASATKVADAITERLELMRPQTEALKQRAARAGSPRAKVILMRELADGVGAAARGLAPCKAGCNHCCYMPVLVGPEEAAQIAKDTGAPLAKPALSGVAKMHYSGSACTFLTPGGCAIYAHRPYACRLHYAVDRDNTLCQIVPGESIRSPHLNVGEYDIAYVTTFPVTLAKGFADVREFFPKGVGKPGRPNTRKP